MTVTDEPLVDQKAGWSSICRAGDHRMCEVAKARCTCQCHGAPQEPPQRQEKKPMSEATVTPLPSKPILVERHDCEHCDRSFGGAHALRIHVARSHKTDRPAKKPRDMSRTRPKLDTESIKASLDPGDDYDPWVVLVGHGTDEGPAAEAAIVSTKGDAAQVVRLLAALGQKAWCFRLADGHLP